MLNTATSRFIGRLTANPAFASYNNGKVQILDFSIACDAGYQGKDGWVDRTQFFPIKTFGKLAKAIYDNDTLGKGDLVIVGCGIINKTYEKDGNTVYKTEYHMTDFKRLVNQSKKVESSDSSESTGKLVKDPLPTKKGGKKSVESDDSATVIAGFEPVVDESDLPF